MDGPREWMRRKNEMYRLQREARLAERWTRREMKRPTKDLEEVQKRIEERLKLFNYLGARRIHCETSWERITEKTLIWFR
jgi:hypothetical protein